MTAFCSTAAAAAAAFVCILLCCVLFLQKRKENNEEEVTPETLERDIKARVSYSLAWCSCNESPSMRKQRERESPQNKPTNNRGGISSKQNNEMESGHGLGLMIQKVDEHVERRKGGGENRC